jgi:enoyl-CoA hydratase
MADEIICETPITGVKLVRFNRPDSLNAFTFPMYEQLLDILSTIRSDPTVRVMILTGTGRGFCSGHDLKAGGVSPYAVEGFGKLSSARLTIAALNRVPVAMRALPQPIICAVNGVTAGMGYALALACDMIVVGKSAKFVNTIHNAATGAELGLSYTLPRAIGTQRAAELLLTARPVLADEAVQIGLALRAVDDVDLLSACLDIARAIIVNVPVGVALTKESLWINQSAGSMEAALAMEERATMMAYSTEDADEKRAAFWEKREPVFKNS